MSRIGAEEKRREFRCDECGELCHDAYMVHNYVWERAKKDKEEKLHFLHFHCLEKRLGRELTMADFPTYGVNSGIRFGFSLAKRTAEENCNDSS
jgi:ribosomal protein L33